MNASLADFEESIRIAWSVVCDVELDDEYEEVVVCWEAIEQAAALLGVDIVAIRTTVEAQALT